MDSNDLIMATHVHARMSHAKFIFKICLHLDGNETIFREWLYS